MTSINLEAFKNAVGQGSWLAVDGADKSKVVGKAKQDAIALKDLTALRGDAVSKAADNIYLRGQLLEAIRGSLVANKLMRIVSDGRQSAVAYAQESEARVKAFFEAAERTLFGELAGRQYGVGTASQDLSSATVKDLLDRLDDLVRVKTVAVGPENSEWELVDVAERELTTVQKELRAKCPNATDRQRSALNCLKPADLARALGIKEKDAGKLAVSSVSVYGSTGFLKCGLKGPGGTVRNVLVDRDGVLFSFDDFEACSRYVSAGPDDAANPIARIGRQELKCAHSLLKLLSAGLRSSPRNAETDALLPKSFAQILVGALPRARALQGKGEISLGSLWTALHLEGPAPRESAKDAAVRFADALRGRIVADFAKAALGESLEEDVGAGRFRDFLTRIAGGADYRETLLAARFELGALRPTAVQADALLYPDVAALSKATGLRGGLTLERVRPGRDGESVACAVRGPDGRTAEVVIAADGRVYQAEAFNRDYDRFVETMESVEVNQSVRSKLAFGPDEWGAVNYFIGLCKDGGNAYAGSAGQLDRESVCKVAVSMLASALRPLVRKNPGKTPGQLLPDLWKALNLPGKAPKAGSGGAALAFFSAVRNRCFQDMAKIYGWGADRNVRLAVCPQVGDSPDDVDQAENALIESGRFSSCTQTVGTFCDITLLPYDRRILSAQGKFNPAMRDVAFDPSPMQRQPDELQGGQLSKEQQYAWLRGGFVGELKTYVCQRLSGVVFQLDVGRRLSCNLNTTDGELMEAFDFMKSMGYEPRQIYQFMKYMNNGGVALQSGMGGAPYGERAVVEILPPGGSGAQKELRVRARLPIARRLGNPQMFMNPVTKAMESKPALRISSEFIVHEFAIGPDGTAKTSDVRVVAGEGQANEVVVPVPAA